jgi:hypothetical protein
MKTHIDTLRIHDDMQHGATKRSSGRLVQVESFFCSLSKMKREDGTHLRPLNQKEIGMS